MGTLLQRHLQDELGREVLFLHGGTPKRRRDAMVERFQASGDDGAAGLRALAQGGRHSAST